MAVKSPNREGQNSLQGAPEPGALETAKEKRIDFLTARQLAEILQVSESTIHRLRRAGRIPAVSLTARLIRFNLRDVQKALRHMQSGRVQNDGGQGETVDEPEASPQLSFEDLFSDFEA